MAFRESSDIPSPVFHAISPDSIKQRISDRPILRNWIFLEIFSTVSCDISSLVHWNLFKTPQIHCCIVLKLLAKLEDNLTSRSWEIWLFMNFYTVYEIYSCVSYDISRLVHWNFFKIPQIHCCIALWLPAKFEDDLPSRSWEIWLFRNSISFMEIFSCVSCDISKSAHGNFFKIPQIHCCIAL